MRKLLTGLLLVAMACGGDSNAGITAPPVSIVGTYSLKTVGGSPLPATVVLSGLTAQVTQGTISMNTDQTFSYTITVAVGTATNTPRIVGTYTSQGTAFVLSSAASPASVTGSFTGGNTISFVDSGLSLTFQR